MYREGMRPPAQERMAVVLPLPGEPVMSPKPLVLERSSGKILLQYGYDKNRNITGLADVTGKKVRYVYDALNRLERIEDPAQRVALAGYQYTDFSQIRTLEYGNGIRSKYQYDEAG